MTRTNHILQAGGLALGAALVLGGCATQPTEPAAEAEMTMKEKAAKAVSDAEAAVEKTRSETDDVGLWKSTKGILENAQNSLEQGDYQAAIDAANKAEEQADLGLEQYREEQDDWKKAVSSAKKSGEFAEEEWVGAGAEAEAQAKERQSVANGTLIMGPGEEGTYRVGKGDNLWDIASADAIYGDAFAWPLIYKANSGKIDDPDLIFPEQEFTIQWDVDSAAYDAAVRHAKTRGAWTLGETEDSDLDYLSQY
jgi:nucleoid-associated protein YgaU